MIVAEAIKSFKQINYIKIIAFKEKRGYCFRSMC
jgi:hypothetical protein